MYQRQDEEVCLRAFTSGKSYPDAQAECAQHGARLATAKTRDAITFLFSQLPATTSSFWVGVDDRETEGRFVWSDGSVLPLDSELWGERNQDHLDAHDGRDCVAASRQPALWDGGCPDRKSFFCQMPPTDKGYLGCFKDSAARILGVKDGEIIGRQESMTPRSCQAQCRAKGYTISGVEDRNWCTCGNTLAFSETHTKVEDSECNMACTGDANFKCGGAWRLSVYLTADFGGKK